MLDWLRESKIEIGSKVERFCSFSFRDAHPWTPVRLLVSRDLGPASREHVNTL